MKHFKLPLIVTGVATLLFIGIGIGLITLIHKSTASAAEKQVRAEKLGGGLGLLTCLGVAPFWLFAAAKVGKERRAAAAAAKAADSETP